MQKQLNQALTLHQNGQLDEAKPLYKTILDQHPDHAECLHLLGILHGQQGNTKDALFYLQKALNIEPTSPAIHNSLANTYKRENTEKAVEHYNKAIELKPDYATAYNNLGIILQKQNRIPLAMEHYQQAINLLPNYSDAHHNLAMLYLEQRQLALAKKHYERLLSIDDSDPRAHHNIATIFLQENEPHKAILHFEKTILIDPEYLEAHINLANTCMMLFQSEKALVHFHYALQHRPNDALILYNIGTILMYQEKLDPALTYLEQALRVQPHYLEALIHCAAVYVKKKLYKKALTFYKDAKKLSPDNDEINFVIDALKQSKHTPKKAPPGYIKSLFDQYAPRYDKHLTDILKYQSPQLLYKLVDQHLPNDNPQWKIVDLGCGTGICADYFSPLAGELIGIDLSSKMLEVADERSKYTQLIVDDIENALITIGDIDLLLAADVLPYLGDLSSLFQRCHASLKNNGLFAFSIEKCHKKLFELQTSARYRHEKSYIEMLCKQYGFDILECDNTEIRKQDQKPVEGYLFLIARVK